ELEHGLVDHGPVYIDNLGFGLFGDESRDDLLRDEAQADQGLSDKAAVSFFLTPRQVKLRLRDVTRFDQPLTEPGLRVGGIRCVRVWWQSAWLEHFGFTN